VLESTRFQDARRAVGQTHERGTASAAGSFCVGNLPPECHGRAQQDMTAARRARNPAVPEDLVPVPHGPLTESGGSGIAGIHLRMAPFVNGCPHELTQSQARCSIQSRKTP